MLISGRDNLAAGGVNNNIFAGTYIEFMPSDGILQFGMTTDEAAATFDTQQIDILCGTMIIANNYNPPATGANPVYPDHYVLSCPAPAGERIIGKHRNTAAGAKNLFWTVMFDMA